MNDETKVKNAINAFYKGARAGLNFKLTSISVL